METIKLGNIFEPMEGYENHPCHAEWVEDGIMWTCPLCPEFYIHVDGEGKMTKSKADARKIHHYGVHVAATA
jgi:hypothetical protein